MIKKITLFMSLFIWGYSNNDFSKLQLNEKIYQINKYINSFPYKKDEELYGFRDYKASLKEFIHNNGGDCEDYAIAKYELYIQNGLNPKDFIMIYGTYKNQAHMVLGYKNELLNKNWIVLDNLRVRPMNFDTIIKDFKPIYSYNPKSNDLYSYNTKTKSFDKLKRKYIFKKILY